MNIELVLATARAIQTAEEMAAMLRDKLERTMRGELPWESLRSTLADIGTGVRNVATNDISGQRVVEKAKPRIDKGGHNEPSNLPRPADPAPMRPVDPLVAEAPPLSDEEASYPEGVITADLPAPGIIEKRPPLGAPQHVHGADGSKREIVSYVNPRGDVIAARLTRITKVQHYVDSADGKVKSIGLVDHGPMAMSAAEAPAPHDEAAHLATPLWTEPTKEGFIPGK